MYPRADLVHIYWLRRERRPHMRSNFLCMSSFPANIPAKPAPFSFGLGNGDNRSFQPNLDLALPKWLTLKLATNYLPTYLSHPFQVLISSLLLIKTPPIFLATSPLISEQVWRPLSFLFFFHTSWGKIPQRVTFPGDSCIYPLIMFWTHKEEIKKGSKRWEMAVGTREAGKGRASVPETREAHRLALFSDTHVQQPVKCVSMEKSWGIHKSGFSCTFAPHYYYLTRQAVSKEQALNVPTLRLKTKVRFDCSSTSSALQQHKSQVAYEHPT